MNHPGRRPDRSMWQNLHTDLKLPIVALFLSTGLVATMHGFTVPVQPIYWLLVAAMLVILLVGAIPDWRALSPFWRIPLQIFSLTFSSTILYFGRPWSSAELLFIPPMLLASLFTKGGLRVALQSLTALVGTNLIFGGMHSWDWWATLLIIMGAINWVVDRLLQSIRREFHSARHFRMMGETAKALLQRTDEGLLEEICQQALTAFGAVQCLLFVISDDKATLLPRAEAVAPGLGEAVALFQEPLPMGEGLTGWVAQRGEPVYSPDVARDPRANCRRGQAPSGSAICLPVVDAGGILGVLRIYSPETYRFTDEEFELAKLWAADVGTVLQRARLYQRLEQMAHTDGLTGIYNRHYLSERWPEVVKQSTRQGTPVALLMLDCFNFKQVNDRYGHLVGDHLLRELGRILREITPPGGFAVRYGGDEFLVVLPGASQEEAEEVKAAIQHRISLVAFACPEQPSLTVDIGLYSGSGGDLAQLLTQADHRLYQDREQTTYQRLQSLLENSVSERSKHMVQAVMSLTKIQELSDPYTRGHSERAKEIAIRTARRLGMRPEEVQLVGFGAVLHDVGKIVVPPDILHKPGPLTEEEWRIMRMHPVFGANIVGELDSLKPVKPLILHHHERYDGMVEGKHPGYPKGLRGEEIPLGARIIAVVDAFDAMTTDRVYRKGQPIQSALGELRRMAGVQFDPMVVEAFEKVVQEIEREFRRGQGGGRAAELPMRFAGDMEHPLADPKVDKSFMFFANRR